MFSLLPAPRKAMKSRAKMPCCSPRRDAGDAGNAALAASSAPPSLAASPAASPAPSPSLGIGSMAAPKLRFPRLRWGKPVGWETIRN